MGRNIRSYIVDITLRPEQLEAYYAGQVSAVWARDVRGVRLQFPLTGLRHLVTRNGIQGRFEVRVDQQNRLVDVQPQKSN